MGNRHSAFASEWDTSPCDLNRLKTIIGEPKQKPFPVHELSPAYAKVSSRVKIVPFCYDKRQWSMTVLHFVFLEGGTVARGQVLPLLFSLGADPNVLDSRGQTPLYVWAMVEVSGFSAGYSSASALLKAGADVNRGTQTPLDCLVSRTPPLRRCGCLPLGAVSHYQGLYRAVLFLLGSGAIPTERTLKALRKSKEEHECAEGDHQVLAGCTALENMIVSTAGRAQVLRRMAVAAAQSYDRTGNISSQESESYRQLEALREKKEAEKQRQAEAERKAKEAHERRKQAAIAACGGGLSRFRQIFNCTVRRVDDPVDMIKSSALYHDATRFGTKVILIQCGPLKPNSVELQRVDATDQDRWDNQARIYSDSHNCLYGIQVGWGGLGNYCHKTYQVDDEIEVGLALAAIAGADLSLHEVQQPGGVDGAFSVGAKRQAEQEARENVDNYLIYVDSALDLN